jgi:hypothetical protein
MNDSGSVPEVIVSFTDNHDKILNPHQRQLLEDTRRVKEQMEQLERQRGFRGSFDLYVRKAEEKFDPDEMDKLDSFYHTTKSLLVLFQIMGVMPIMRAPSGETSCYKCDIICPQFSQFETRIRFTPNDILVDIESIHLGLFHLRH